MHITAFVSSYPAIAEANSEWWEVVRVSTSDGSTFEAPMYTTYGCMQCKRHILFYVNVLQLINR